jgi:hypothetical protein
LHSNEVWNLMDTPIDEQRSFDHVTSLIKVSPNIAMPQGCLAHELINKVTIFRPLLFSFVCSFMTMVNGYMKFFSCIGRD